MKRGGLQIAICWLDHCAPDEKGRESGIHGRDSMARIYRVRTRDTLRKIAERFYRETECLERLALYNGILDPDRIWGWTIDRDSVEAGAFGGESTAPRRLGTSSWPGRNPIHLRQYL